MIFALVTQTTLVSTGELYRLCHPLEWNAGDCARSWNRTPPAIVVIDDVTKVPAYAQPIVFTESNDPSALGVRHWDALRGLALRVFVNNATGLLSGPKSVLETTGHEILEAIVDPMTATWMDLVGEPGTQVALEICDPVQDTYGFKSKGQRWEVPNFVLPSWFDPRFAGQAGIDYRNRNGRYDFANRLDRPGEIGPDGYVVARHPIDGGTGYATYLRGGCPGELQLAEAKKHPWARTQIRLG